MDELIKKSDAIEAIKDNSFALGDDYMEINGYGAIDDIRALPSADRPQGEWIRDRYWSRGVGMGEEYGFFYKCSMCEYEVESGYTRCGFNYCPNCGADMRKGADDE